jgi:hypothetical protein
LAAFTAAPLGAPGNGQPQRAKHGRAHRPYLAKRLAARGVRCETMPIDANRSAPMPILAALTDEERARRLQRVTRVLVRTMNSCPAPGVAPFRVRDWLLIWALVAGPYLFIFALAALAPPR